MKLKAETTPHHHAFYLNKDNLVEWLRSSGFTSLHTQDIVAGKVSSERFEEVRDVIEDVEGCSYCGIRIKGDKHNVTLSTNGRIKKLHIGYITRDDLEIQ